MSGARVAPGKARHVQRDTASIPAQATNSSTARKPLNDQSARQHPSTTPKAVEMGGARLKTAPVAISKRSCQLISPPQCPCSICSASLDPPITRETLSELDWDQISNNLLLRHDLNFEPHIQYRPNTHGPRGQERMTQTYLYWEAMTVVIEVYLAEKGGKCLNHTQTCSRNPIPSPKSQHQHRQISERFPRMLEAVRETLKTIVPEKEHHAIDSRLDVDLLMQQVEHGICDFISLGECLASLLRRFCYPERDHLFDDMTARMRLGVLESDAQLIVNGLRCAFNILEIMRLVGPAPFTLSWA